MADITFQNLLQCVEGFFEYSKAILSVTDENSLKFVPGLHSNQSSLENFFSRMRKLGKDRTDLYAGGVLQQNVINDIHGYQKKKIKGNLSYPASMSTEEHLPVRKETRIGDHVVMKRKRIEIITDVAIGKLQVEGSCSSYVFSDYQSFGSAFGNIFNGYIRTLMLPDGQNYQTYILNDIYYQGCYSLSLGTMSEQWFTNMKEQNNKKEVIKLCNVFTKKLFQLFEKSLMEVDKSRVSYQLTLLNFIQQDGMKELLTDINDDIKHDSQCLLLLFMFLSNKLIHSWLPCLLKSHKDSITPVSSYNKKVDHINIISDGEVNRLVGWALFAEIKKCKQILKNTNDLKMFERQETEETINILIDMKAIECEILTNSEYIRRYYFIDDAIRNKGTLTLISPPYIQEFSKLSQRVTNSYRSTESMKKSSGNIKTEVIKN